MPDVTRMSATDVRRFLSDHGIDDLRVQKVTIDPNYLTVERVLAPDERPEGLDSCLRVETYLLAKS